jgi:hypothetical protein
MRGIGDAIVRRRHLIWTLVALHWTAWWRRRRSAT